MDQTDIQNGFYSKQVQGVDITKYPIASSQNVITGSPRSRRYGRTAVPAIRIQDSENNNTEDKTSIAECCDPDKNTEREQTPMRFNIVVSPTKLVSLSKHSFILDQKQSKEPSNCEEVKTDDHNLKVSKVEATEAESPTENRSNSVPENRGLSPVYHRVPNLEERKQSLTNLMQQDSRKRRDSVAAMPTAKSRTDTEKTHRRLSVGPTPAVPRRRSSVKETLSSYYVRPVDTPNGNHQDQVTHILENLSENHLMVGLESDDFKTAQITKGKLDVSIPVLHVVKDDRKLCITDIVAIEEYICNQHPELTILKIPSKTKATEEQDHSDRMHEIVPGNSLTVIAEDQTSKPNSSLQNDGTAVNERKISIRTCVNGMKEDKEDYAKQLQGCKNVGTFAAMETVHVLLSRQDAVRCVLEAMRTFQDKEELQRSACQSLLMMTSASG